MAKDFSLSHTGWGRNLRLETSRVDDHISLSLVLATVGSEGVFTHMGIALSLQEAEQLAGALTTLVADHHEQRRQVQEIVAASLGVGE